MSTPARIFDMCSVADAECIAMHREEDAVEPHGHITSLAVARSHRKLGLASRLMQAAREDFSQPTSNCFLAASATSWTLGCSSAAGLTLCSPAALTRVPSYCRWCHGKRFRGSIRFTACTRHQHCRPPSVHGDSGLSVSHLCSCLLCTAHV